MVPCIDTWLQRGQRTRTLSIGPFARLDPCLGVSHAKPGNLRLPKAWPRWPMPMVRIRMRLRSCPWYYTICATWRTSWNICAARYAVGSVTATRQVSDNSVRRDILYSFSGIKKARMSGLVARLAPVIVEGSWTGCTSVLQAMFCKPIDIALPL